ncbi:unnamed protein product [Rotaria sp. Silwood1]|nr:unnamed protein product [Rotaria sp. Silwood1]CAF1658862.1 unnamed protein product [Rotaria sp. Silwood1]CAF3892023.1 unnamed protein product [Rotaria sp. Silwood1]
MILLGEKENSLWTFAFERLKLEESYAYQSSNRLHPPNQQDKYSTIIEKDIEAVNAYHTFANESIRPGAYDDST